MVPEAALLCLLMGAVGVRPHTLVLIPSEVQVGTLERICLVDGHEGRKGAFSLRLHHVHTNTELLHNDTLSIGSTGCLEFVLPDMDVSNQWHAVAELRVMSLGENPRINMTRRVVLKRYDSITFIQSDKPVYKPGQTVRFRIVSLDQEFLPTGEKYPQVTLQDPKRNLIGQWTDVESSQGIADLSFNLIPDSPLGNYEIWVKKHRGRTSHHFTVEEYVLPKFELTVHLPELVTVLDKTIHVKLCGRYTYGKPMRGHVNGTVCLRPYYAYVTADQCHVVEGETNRDGCFSQDVSMAKFRLRNNWNSRDIHADFTLDEEGTGIRRHRTASSRIASEITKTTFEDVEEYFKKGIPFTGKVVIKYVTGKPMAGVKVYLFHSYAAGGVELLMDQHGSANFSFDTSSWGTDPVTFLAMYQLQQESHHYSSRIPSHASARHSAKPFYSRSGSFLSIEKARTELPCDGELKVPVRYVLRGEGESGIELALFYALTMVRGKITCFRKLEISDREKQAHHFILPMPLSPDLAPVARVLVFAVLPDGELIGDAVRYSVSKCFRNKVHLHFSSAGDVPHSPVNLEVQADSGSLCGLRVVDQSVLLLKPEKELSADSVYQLLPVSDLSGYPYPVYENANEFCGPPSAGFWPTRQNRDSVYDLARQLEQMGLKAVTDLDYHVRLNCEWTQPMYHQQRYYAVPGVSMSTDYVSSITHFSGTMVGSGAEAERVREYFPETWIWDLLPVGSSGRNSLDLTTPDTVTEWKGSAFCVGHGGFGISETANFIVFKPFFVEMALPYSVVRTESFTLKAKVFNYLEQSLWVTVTLLESDGFELLNPHRIGKHCVLAKDGITVSWKLKATGLGKMNITVRAESVHNSLLCGNEVVAVPSKGAVDTVRQSLLIQPEGTKKELTHSSLLCPAGETLTEEIHLELPDNVVAGSDRGYIMVLGDIMSSAMENLDSLLTLPTGCGEQNMVKFAPNIFVLSYLENTHQASPKVKAKALGFLETGYQRQLTYKHSDGSFSAFGESDPEGNTWLTAFVLKSFLHAQKYIFIDEKVLQQSAIFFLKHRMESGCFASIGRLFNNAMKGGVEDHISLSAYVTIALLEFQRLKPKMANEVYEEIRNQKRDKDTSVEKESPSENIPPLNFKTDILDSSLRCLREALGRVNNTYTLALLAYTFTLAGDLPSREHLLNTLDKLAVHEDGLTHWRRPEAPEEEEEAEKRNIWWRAPSAEVEMTAYVLLALTSSSHVNPHLDLATSVVQWLVRQRNAYGGFASTQDTVVALQALSLYGSMTHTANPVGNVRVTGVGDFIHDFHLDASNLLVVQRAAFPSLYANYTVTVNGGGCVLLQTSLLYNIPPSTAPSPFSLSLHLDPLDSDNSMGKIHIHITFVGSRNVSNMVIAEVKLPSGFSSDVNQNTNPSASRTEQQDGLVVIYITQLQVFDPIDLLVPIHRDFVVENLQKSYVKVYDYYETDEFAIVGYQWPQPGETH